jgi:hypothetical protein
MVSTLISNPELIIIITVVLTTNFNSFDEFGGTRLEKY